MGDLVEAELFTAVVLKLALLFIKGCFIKFGVGHTSFRVEVCSNVTVITFVIHVGADTWLSTLDALKILTVIALGVLFTTDVGDLLTEEALLSVAVAAIIRCPKLKVRLTSARTVNTFTLLLMEVGEIKIR